MTDIIAVYEQVEKIMGVKAPMPVVEIGNYNKYQPNNVRTAYNEARVTVIFNQCLDINLAHEFSHHLAVAGGLLEGVENKYVMGVLAEIALDAEEKYSAGVKYMPNCVGTQ